MPKLTVRANATGYISFIEYSNNILQFEESTLKNKTSIFESDLDNLNFVN